MNAITITKPVDHANHFVDFWELGYTGLLPVVPHTAPLTNAGKRPGVKEADGTWSGRGSASFLASPDDLDRWHGMGAGVGLRANSDIIGIDIDVLDQTFADKITKATQKHLGAGAVRIGQAPKTLLMFRVTAPMRWRGIPFDAGTEKPGLVELQAGDTRWFVVHGIHPKTQQPYYWPEGAPRKEDLPVVTPEEVTLFMDKLEAELPGAKRYSAGSTDRSTVDQSTIKAPDLDLVAPAMAVIPNASAKIGYGQWVEMAVALRGACQDDPNAGLDLFLEWTDRTDLPEQTEDPDRTYWSVNEPFAFGWSYIRNAARRHGWTGDLEKLYLTDLELNPPPPAQPRAPDAEPSIWDLAPAESDAAQVVRIKPTTFQLRPLTQIPRREWVYGHHLVRAFVSATIAPGGLGKSSLIIAEALAMASGKPLLGVKSRGTFRVWLWNGEDPADELERRVGAAMQFYGLTQADIGDRLLVDSGRDMELVLARQERGGAAVQQPVANALEAALRDRKIDVMQIDPFISSHRVRESDNDDIDLVVKQWGRIAGRCGVAIELVHHVRKGNGQETTVDDARGASAFLSATRSARVLSRMTPQEAKTMGVGDQHRRFFRIGVDGKTSMTPGLSGDATKWFELHSVDLANGEGEGVDAIMTGDSVGVVSPWVGAAPASAVAENATEQALKDIAAGEWRMDSRAQGDWVGQPVSAALGLMLDDPSDKAQVNAWIKAMLSDGRLKQTIKLDRNRKPRPFVEVVVQTAIPSIFN